MNEVNENIPGEVLKPQDAFSASRISLIINNYDDIFSDFDPRPSSVRTLSDDFIVELRKAIRSKSSDSLELLLLAPAKSRVYSEEAIIKKRIHEYFRRRKEQLVQELNKEIRKGIIMAVIGVSLGIAATVISLNIEGELIKSSMLTILEPASWFTIWSGFDRIFLLSDSRKTELDFYEKMSKIEIYFQSY